MFSICMLELMYFSFSIKINVLQGHYIETLQEKDGQDMDYMVVDFDKSASYTAGGGVLHGRYFILCHFISYK
jgi:hypothetical protein